MKARQMIKKFKNNSLFPFVPSKRNPNTMMFFFQTLMCYQFHSYPTHVAFYSCLLSRKWNTVTLKLDRATLKALLINAVRFIVTVFWVITPPVTIRQITKFQSQICYHISSLWLSFLAQLTASLAIIVWVI